MNLTKEYNELNNELNSVNNLNIAIKLVKKLNLHSNIPYFKTFHIKTNEQKVKYSYLFGLIKGIKVGLVDSYYLQVLLTKKNRLKVIKYYEDDTDYGMSEMSCEDNVFTNTLVNIKLKKLIKSKL